MGDAFGNGLIKTAGLGEVLNLSKGKLGGDRATSIAAVAQLMRGLKSLDLSKNKLNANEVKELAGAILANASLTQVMYVSRTDLKPPCFYAAHMLLQIDLSGNQIGGYQADLRIVSTPEGPKAIADAIRVSPSITSVGKDGLNLKKNYFGAEGWGAIFAAICSSQVSNITSVDASGENIGPEGAKLIGQALGNSVNPSVTSVRANIGW